MSKETRKKETRRDRGVVLEGSLIRRMNRPSLDGCPREGRESGSDRRDRAARCGLVGEPGGRGKVGFAGEALVRHDPSFVLLPFRSSPTSLFSPDGRLTPGERGGAFLVALDAPDAPDALDALDALDPPPNPAASGFGNNMPSIDNP
ncbi:hypothetical protein KM043_000889 [Ampulex compressa]|nr:hypothetical protein KM043_000889 [Ampulex compressa]